MSSVYTVFTPYSSKWSWRVQCRLAYILLLFWLNSKNCVYCVGPRMLLIHSWPITFSYENQSLNQKKNKKEICLDSLFGTNLSLFLQRIEILEKIRCVITKIMTISSIEWKHVLCIQYSCICTHTITFNAP